MGILILFVAFPLAMYWFRSEPQKIRVDDKWCDIKYEGTPVSHTYITCKKDN